MFGRSLGVTLSAVVVLALGLSLSARAEVTTLKAVSAFPKSHALTKSFLTFIDMLNKDGKGHVQARHIGGPEVTPPSKQPIALRNGLFDLVYGPPAYYLGLFPDGDALEGFKTAAENRAGGGFAMLDKAARNKLGATLVARPDVGIGLYLFLEEKPKFTPAGLVDLSGMKIRGSASYIDFIKALGGTAIVMRGGQIYTALERGVIDGAGTGLSSFKDLSLVKFLKYRIEPNFSVGSIVVIGNAKRIDGMSAKARSILKDIAMRWEESSRKAVAARESKIKRDLDKSGQKVVRLEGKAGAAYVEAYMSKPWQRLRSNPKVEIDVDKARAAFY